MVKFYSLALHSPSHSHTISYLHCQVCSREFREFREFTGLWNSSSFGNIAPRDSGDLNQRRWSSKSS